MTKGPEDRRTKGLERFILMNRSFGKKMALWLEWKNPASYLSWLVRDVVQLIQLKVQSSFYDLLGDKVEYRLPQPRSEYLSGRLIQVHRRADESILAVRSWGSVLIVVIFFPGQPPWWKTQITPSHSHMYYLYEEVIYYLSELQVWRLDCSIGSSLEPILYRDLTACPLFSPESLEMASYFRHLNSTHLIFSHNNAEENEIIFHCYSLFSGTYRSLRIIFSGRFGTTLSDTHLFIYRETGEVMAINLETSQTDYQFIHPAHPSPDDRYSQDLILLKGNITSFVTQAVLLTISTPTKQIFTYSRNNRLYRVKYELETQEEVFTFYE